MQIDRIMPNLYNNLVQQYSLHSLLAQATIPPYQVYRFPEGQNVSRKALQLPYRIILTSTNGGRETWYIENENEFAQLAKLFLKARRAGDDDRVINSVVEQQPV